MSTVSAYSDPISLGSALDLTNYDALHLNLVTDTPNVEFDVEIQLTQTGSVKYNVRFPFELKNTGVYTGGVVVGTAEDVMIDISTLAATYGLVNNCAVFVTRHKYADATTTWAEPSFVTHITCTYLRGVRGALRLNAITDQATYLTYLNPLAITSLTYIPPNGTIPNVLSAYAADDATHDSISSRWNGSFNPFKGMWVQGQVTTKGQVKASALLLEYNTEEGKKP